MQPILIVGAGPVGLTMAAELARFGVSVRLIDQSPEPTSTSKALVVWSRTLELMDRMRCTPAFLDAGLKARLLSFRSGASALGQAGFDHISSPYNFALMIPQSDTERLLYDHLRSFGGGVDREVALIDFESSAECVKAKLRHGSGQEETIETPWLIGCDGAHSTVRHGLGLEFRGSVEGDDWILADVRLTGDGKPAEDEIAPFLHDDGPLGVFPMPGDRTRVIAAVGRSVPASARPAPTLADVQALIDRRTGGGFQASDPVWLSNFQINERKVAEYRRGRIFLAGDAAHIHSPFGAQGMNTGMQDAFNLAWKLALVVRGEARDALLDSYSPERSRVANMVVRNASLLTDMASLSNPLIVAARNLALHAMLGLHAVEDRLATTLSEVDIGYAESSLSIGKHGGRRLDPDDYNGAPPGSGTAPRWVLYAADLERATTLVRRYPTILEPAPRTVKQSQGLLVVRPDGYIGFGSGREQWREVDDYIGQFATSTSSAPLHRE